MFVSRQKVHYQRNMLIGQAVTIGLAGILALVIHFSPGPQLKESSAGIMRLGSERLVEALNSISRPFSSGEATDGSTELRFGLKPIIVADSYLTRQKSIGAGGGVGHSLTPELVGSGLGSPYGSRFGSFLGEGELRAYFDEIDRPSELLSQPVKISNTRPPEYPLIAKLDDREGKVEILVLIDSLGRFGQFPYQAFGQEELTVNHVILNEEPTDWFFARNAYEAIQHWQFSPAVENGRAVSRYVKITVHFCLSLYCHWIEMEQLPAP